jgi:hypothetical protein
MLANTERDANHGQSYVGGLNLRARKIFRARFAQSPQTFRVTLATTRDSMQLFCNLMANTVGESW